MIKPAFPHVSILLVNDALGFVIHFIGGFKENWKIQHNVLHHSYTNVHGYDEARIDAEEMHEYEVNINKFLDSVHKGSEKAEASLANLRHELSMTGGLNDFAERLRDGGFGKFMDISIDPANALRLEKLFGTDEGKKLVGKLKSTKLTLENLKKYNSFSKENPNVRLNIDTTASIFNITHIPELIKWKLSQPELAEINKWPVHGGMIGIHFLYNPKFLSVKCLPKELKEKASDEYTDLYKWLEQNFEHYTDALEKPNGIKKLRSLIDFMWSEDLSHLLPLTNEYIRRLEVVRKLNFCEIFPELEELYNYGK